MTTFQARVTVVNDKVNDENLITFCRKYATMFVIGFDDADEQVNRPHYHLALWSEKTAASIRNALTRTFEVKGEDYSLKTEPFEHTQENHAYLSYCVKNKLVLSTWTYPITKWLSKKDFVKKVKSEPKTRNKGEDFVKYLKEQDLTSDVTFEDVARHLFNYTEGKVNDFHAFTLIQHAMFMLSEETRYDARENFISRMADKMRPRRF